VQDLDLDGRFGLGPFFDTNGNRIRSVLCMPIHNSEKHIIGVTQLINKVNGEPFNDNDVNIIEVSDKSQHSRQYSQRVVVQP
jgi:dual 3',5'-cyclic-AMP and -GMP phosphodiesterase 11